MRALELAIERVEKAVIAARTPEVGSPLEEYFQVFPEEIQEHRDDMDSLVRLLRAFDTMAHGGP